MSGFRRSFGGGVLLARITLSAAVFQSVTTSEYAAGPMLKVLIKTNILKIVRGFVHSELFIIHLEEW